MIPPWPLLLVLLAFPVLMALLDCWQRPEDQFAEGADDRRAWLRWLGVALLTFPILVGYGIVLGYYHAVIRRGSPSSPR